MPLEFGHFGLRLVREKLVGSPSIKKIRGWEEGFVPAPLRAARLSEPLTRSGDKSLFPTCDFLMFDEKTDFFPPKSSAQNDENGK